jgi:hypothetical protein
MPGVNLCENVMYKQSAACKSFLRTPRMAMASNADHVLQHRWEKKWRGDSTQKKLPSAIFKLINANFAIPMSGQSNKSYSLHVFFSNSFSGLQTKHIRTKSFRTKSYQGTKPMGRTKLIGGHNLCFVRR